eukprot:SAG31_NODE_4763_length_2973_cov_1.655532_5_plen_81_part_00
MGELAHFRGLEVEKKILRQHKPAETRLPGAAALLQQPSLLLHIWRQEESNVVVLVCVLKAATKRRVADAGTDSRECGSAL